MLLTNRIFLNSPELDSHRPPVTPVLIVWNLPDSSFNFYSRAFSLQIRFDPIMQKVLKVCSQLCRILHYNLKVELYFYQKKQYATVIFKSGNWSPEITIIQLI